MSTTIIRIRLNKRSWNAYPPSQLRSVRYDARRFPLLGSNGRRPGTMLNIFTTILEFLKNVLGLLLVPNGKYFGQLMGDVYPEEELLANNEINTLTGNETDSTTATPDEADVINTVVDTSSHPWGIFLTVLGTVLLDFDADACQSPSRAYLLDVCVPGSHLWVPQ